MRRDDVQHKRILRGNDIQLHVAKPQMHKVKVTFLALVFSTISLFSLNHQDDRAYRSFCLVSWRSSFHAHSKARNKKKQKFAHMNTSTYTDICANEHANAHTLSHGALHILYIPKHSRATNAYTNANAHHHAPSLSHSITHARTLPYPFTLPYSVN